MKRLLVIGLLLLATPAFSAYGAETGDREVALLRAENERIAALRALATADTLPSPPPLAAFVGEQAAACGVAYQRLVTVATSDQLHAALRNAQPGDLIHMADGLYKGRFVATANGEAARPIVLCGARAAIIDSGSTETGYGFHLKANHWQLIGFTICNALKGLLADGVHHVLIQGLEVHTIGQEAIHLRKSSVDNQIKQNWVHDTGLRDAQFGEAIYIGSAHSNWAKESAGQADASNRNTVVGNLLGPHVAAEAIDIKEGTENGIIRGNVFLLDGMQVKAAVNIKGNGYRVEGNHGLLAAEQPAKQATATHEVLAGWGRGNIVRDNTVQAEARKQREPFRAAHKPEGPATIVLPPRPQPYTLSEMLARFPASFERISPGVVLLKEHVLLAKGGSMQLGSQDTGELRLLSRTTGFVSLVGFRSSLTLRGLADLPFQISSWNPDSGGPDNDLADGRAYVLVRGGRMDIDYSVLADLGFGLGQTSGVAWKGYGTELSQGDVHHSRFERNQFGAYTYEAENMRWLGNSFTANRGYGFDPHDFSSGFLVEENIASDNGSHGIIFSRGCANNIIRRNTVTNNRGHGIFIDDGKVLKNGDPRYEKPVPSNNNVVEDNLVRGNVVGIAFEGGSGNIVRGNRLEANQSGVRLNDNVSGNTFSDNTINGSSEIAFHLLNGSARNQITGNQIVGGKGGVVTSESPANQITGNTIGGIAGRGIALHGAATDTFIHNNQIAGNGSQAIDTNHAEGIDPARITNNQTSAWIEGRLLSPTEATLLFIQHHPAIILWVLIFCIPFAMRVLTPRRTSI